MKIMIDIDENVFTRLFDNGIEDYEIANDDLSAIAKAIRGGTPLPEGHGDLIDRKELTKYPPIWMEDKRRTGEDDAVILLSDILKVEPIIKGEQE